jgi:hypothetical protein
LAMKEQQKQFQKLITLSSDDTLSSSFILNTESKVIGVPMTH